MSHLRVSKKGWCVVEFRGVRMDVCSLCRCTLKSTGQRRKLHGTSLTHVVAIPQEFIGELWTAASETLFHPEAFLCRPCMRNLEKLRKLRDLLRDKDDEIRQLMNRAMDAHGLVLGSAFSSPARSDRLLQPTWRVPLAQLVGWCSQHPSGSVLQLQLTQRVPLAQ